MMMMTMAMTMIIIIIIITIVIIIVYSLQIFFSNTFIIINPSRDAAVLPPARIPYTGSFGRVREQNVRLHARSRRVVVTFTYLIIIVKDTRETKRVSWLRNRGVYRCM